MPVHFKARWKHAAAGASEEEIRRMTQALGVQLPIDYLEYLLSFNGSEGWIGDNYVILYSCDTMSKTAFVFQEFVPGIAFFGNDGGEGLFGFDTRDPSMPVVITHSDDLDSTSLVTMSQSFTAFMQSLEKHDWIEEWGRKYDLRKNNDDGDAA